MNVVVSDPQLADLRRSLLGSSERWDDGELASVLMAGLRLSALEGAPALLALPWPGPASDSPAARARSCLLEMLESGDDPNLQALKLLTDSRKPVTTRLAEVSEVFGRTSSRTGRNRLRDDVLPWFHDYILQELASSSTPALPPHTLPSESGAGPSSDGGAIVFLTEHLGPSRYTIQRTAHLDILRSTVSEPGSRLTCVGGVSGIGKTTVARSLLDPEVLAEAGLVSAIWYSFSGRQQDATGFLTSLHRSLQPGQEAPASNSDWATWFLDTLRTRRLLLVLDGFELAMDVVDIDQWMCSTTLASQIIMAALDQESLSKVVITSYLAPPVPEGTSSYRFLQLEGLSPDELDALARHHHVTLSEADLRHLLRLGDGHPMVSNVLLAALSLTGSTELLIDVLDDTPSLVHGTEGQRVEIVLRNLWRSLDGTSKLILVALSLLGGRATISEIRTALPDISNLVHLTSAIMNLQRRSLIDAEVSDGVLHVHRLVADFARSEDTQLTANIAAGLLKVRTKSWMGLPNADATSEQFLGASELALHAGQPELASDILFSDTWNLSPRLVSSGDQRLAFALSRKIVARLDATAGIDLEARFLALNRSAWFASKSGYTEAALASYQAVIDADGASELARCNALLDQTELLVELGQYSRASQRLGLPQFDVPSCLGPLNYLYSGRAALVMAGLGDVERSSQLFSETQELLCGSPRDDPFLVLMYRMHAELHRWQSEYNQALNLLDQAEAVICRAPSSGPTMLDYAGHIARARADIAIATGDLALARTLVDDAHRIAINMSYDWLAAEVAVTSGTLQYSAGNLEHAAGSAMQALAIAHSSGFVRQQLEALLLLASVRPEPVAARHSYLLEGQAIQEQSGFVWHQADFEGLLADLDAGERI